MLCKPSNGVNMVHTYFDMVRPKTQGYTLNKYFCHKLDENHYLITVAHGAWLVLDNDEYRLLRLGKIQEDVNLFTALENKGIIITTDNFDTIVKDYRERYHYLFNGVSLHIIHPTKRCNQKCLYCHAQSKSDNLKGFDMDLKTAKATVDFIFQSPAKAIQIEFQGGEPLLNFPVVKYILEYSAKMAKKHNKELGYSLVSNLTLMDDEKLEYLMSVKNFGIATSFDGPKYVHDKNRIYLNGDGTYDDVVKWIKKIKSNKKNGARLNAMPTITKFSLPYAKEIVDEYLRFGFNKTWARSLAKIGNAQATWDKIGYPAHEFVTFWKEFLEYVLEKNRKGIMFSERMTTIYAKKITNKKDPYYSELQAPCGAAIGQMVYDYKGDVFPCDESKIYDYAS